MTRPKSRSVVIHGHFYQPPRADPWLEEMPRQPTAAPFHDWNERINSECYRAVVAARVVNGDGRIVRIVNTLQSISFNFGPTLLEWMEHHAPTTYSAILAADQQSVKSLGFGNAIAMPYHHLILPLCSLRDKRTEVRWGIRDFQRRFKRDPVGMWLPETAVDHETLEVLADEGIAFTILAPRQFQKPPPRGAPGRYQTTSGKSIALFAYDGDVSHDIAFGDLLDDADSLYKRVTEPASNLVAVAADGETFGHHRTFGEMALASFLVKAEAQPDVRVENFASYLARHPPSKDVDLVAPSSWSCAHGVERWRSNCGCRMDATTDTQQVWRTPLRDALNWLAAELHTIFENECAQFVEDPWAARDRYVDVSSGPSAEARDRLREAFPTAASNLTRFAELLEMERSALRMFTSCGWFFDDVAGIETIQVLRYAARAIELAGESASSLENGLTRRLSPAVSNDPDAGTAADIYRREVVPKHPATTLTAAGFAMSRATGAAPTDGYPFDMSQDGETVTVVDRRTGRSSELHVSVDAGSPAKLAAHVTPVGASTTTVALADLPERMRAAIRKTAIDTITRDCLTDDEKNVLLTGQMTFKQVIRCALVRSTRELLHGVTDQKLSTAGRLLDLCELHDYTVPFDAQTNLGRLLHDGATADDQLAVLALRMNLA